MIHFIYRVPPSSKPWKRKLEKWQWKLLHKLRYPLPTVWRRGGPFLEIDTVRAPYSITINLFKYLSERTEVFLYDLLEPVKLRYGPNDIILGHPWMNEDMVTNHAIRNPAPCKLKALIFPIHHGLPEINDYAHSLVERSDIVFGIMGSYWYDTLERSRFASWKPKIVRLDMAIDANAFPYVKTKFNPPGQRGYLYIGRNSPEKGPEILSQTMAGLLDYPRGWIGIGNEIAHLNREGGFTHLTPKVIGELSQKYDFFINTSVSDANPTTILEAMAWGFPVACTPESGYYKLPTIINLSTTNISMNIQKLRKLQYMPEEDLINISLKNRALVEEIFTWDRFGKTVWNHIEPFLSS